MAFRVVIAPDKFKGTITAQRAAEAIARGVRASVPDAEPVLAPMADGGEGTVDAMVASSGGVRHRVVVTGPLGESVSAEFGILADGTAVVEMAQASGLWRVPPERQDPLVTTTYGTGELIEAALDEGCRRIIIGIGGSATCDAGIGAAQALGIKILKADGSPVGFGGGELVKIARIDVGGLDPRVRAAELIAASDVTNPLFGPHGAAHVFAPQKGAGPEAVLLLDQGLVRFAEVVERDLGATVATLPGGGAAGGLGAGLVAFFGATIRPGVELIIEAIGLRDKLTGADLAITGEGQLDRQSAYGKVPSGVARLADELGVPTIAIAGRLGEGYEETYAAGITRAYSLVGIAGSPEAALAQPAMFLERAAAQALREHLARAPE